MFLPIRTETSIRRTPTANYGLLLLNICIFLILDGSRNKGLLEFKEAHFVLNGEWPSFYQLLTYQFAHADGWHLLGNMLFLWVFGNAVNAKLGDLAYVLFYVSGGVFSGIVFGLLSDDSLLGASGAIAAVTTAYLVLFPRSHVTILYVFFFIGFIQVPATLVIGLKIILWDNIISPNLSAGSDEIAYSAHLAGYAFGFFVSLILLWLRVIPRDQFDLLAVAKRWNQRRAFSVGMSSPEAQAQARFGRVANVRTNGTSGNDPVRETPDEETQLRSEISSLLDAGKTDEGITAYEQLIAMNPKQCLPVSQQITVARKYYSTSRFPQAAAAFERFLANYRNDKEANEIRLLLGIICTRDLGHHEQAEKHLEQALAQATSPTRKKQAGEWLEKARAAQGKSGT